MEPIGFAPPETWYMELMGFVPPKTQYIELWVLKQSILGVCSAM